MPAPVSLKKSRASGRDAALPPAKKTKLSQSASTPRQNGFSALLNGNSDTKPPVVAKINGAKNPRKEKVKEQNVAVGGGPAGHGDVDMVDAPKDVIEISSAEESSDLSSSDEEEEETGAGAQEDEAADDVAPMTNGHVEDNEEDPIEDGTVEPEEPSFGERLLQQHQPEVAANTRVVDVEAAFEDPDAEHTALTPARPRNLAAPSTASLGTVLTQALRTNDKDLLDQCLRISDVDTVYATVERLPSPLVGNLLQKLAERLYKKPGRAGMLMVWVQWSLAAHGGYLASQPQLVKQLATLNKVLKERASGLQPLLALKGRLDMLQAQLELRKRNQRRDSDDNEEALIYVEGEDDDSSADDDEDETNRKGGMAYGSDEEDDASSIDQMPTTMEVDGASEEGSEDSEDMLDDEAEETDNDTGDDMSEPMSDDDGFINDGEDLGAEREEETRTPARRSTTARSRNV